MILALLLMAAAPVCTSNADCFVTIDTGCCGCKSLAVHSTLEKKERAPACGCAYEGADQLINPHSRCGPMPPDPSTWRGICRSRVCVAVPVPKKK